jgi:type IV pilus assembly protein PilW
MKCSRLKRSYQAGVSLLELMISITIGVVILGAIFAVYSATSSTGKQSETATRMSEDAAVAMNYMAGYIRMAGYSLPRINAPENSALVGSSTIVITDSNFNGMAIRGCDGGFTTATVTGADTTLLACDSTASSAISVRFEGDVYNTSPSGSSPTDCLNQAVAAGATSAWDGVTTYSLAEARFFVKTGANSGVPELFCAGNGSAGFVAQPIMQYVESLALTYGVADDSSSRLVTRYLTSAALDLEPDTLEQRWKRVVSVKICLVMRSEMRDQNGSGSYVNCAGNVVASAGGFLRRAFTSTVTIRNRGGIS